MRQGAQLPSRCPCMAVDAPSAPWKRHRPMRTSPLAARRPPPSRPPTRPLSTSLRMQLNERLSFGQHKVWKRMAVRWTGAKAGDSALDVCCGSGDLAFELARAVGPSGKVVGLDFAADMLADASAREAQRGSRCAPASPPLAPLYKLYCPPVCRL